MGQSCRLQGDVERGSGSYADFEDGIKSHKPKNESSYSSKKANTQNIPSFQITTESQRVGLHWASNLQSCKITGTWCVMPSTQEFLRCSWWQKWLLTFLLHSLIYQFLPHGKNYNFLSFFIKSVLLSQGPQRKHIGSVSSVFLLVEEAKAKAKGTAKIT